MAAFEDIVISKMKFSHLIFFVTDARDHAVYMP